MAQSKDDQIKALEQEVKARDERLKFLYDMLNIFVISLHTVNVKDDLGGGARMMLASMGRATLKKEAAAREGS